MVSLSSINKKIKYTILHSIILRIKGTIFIFSINLLTTFKVNLKWEESKIWTKCLPVSLTVKLNYFNTKFITLHPFYCHNPNYFPNISKPSPQRPAGSYLSHLDKYIITQYSFMIQLKSILLPVPWFLMQLHSVP
jgi:hypothetical protein